MSRHLTLPIAALVAVLYIFIDSASSQPRAADKPPAAAESSAEHKGMHGMTAKEREQHRKEMHDKMHGSSAKTDDHCKGMMDKHDKRARAHDVKDSGAKDHAGHARHDQTAAADKGCGMGKKH